MTDRKKPGVAFWATVAIIVVLVGYPLSFGPACWWFCDVDYAVEEIRIVPQIYWPIGWVYRDAPDFVRDAIRWYAKLGDLFVSDATELFVPVDDSGKFRFGL